MKKVSTLTILSLCATLPLVAQGINFLDQPEWKEVLTVAAKQNKLIFMDCYTTWCGPCKQLAEKVFPLPEVGNYFNDNFINVKYDMEKGEGKELNQHYKPYIIGYPTMLLIDKDGKVVQQIAGYKEPDALIAAITAGVEGKGFYVLKAKYEAGERDVDFLIDYIAALNAAFLKKEIEAVVIDYMESIPLDSLLTPKNWGIVYEQIKDPYSPQFEHLLRNMSRHVYKPYVNAYQLERQLSRAFDRAIDEITDLQKDRQENILPLKNDPDKIARLRTLIGITDIRRAEAQRAALKLHELKVEGKWSEVLDCMDYYLPIGVLSTSSTNKTIQYLAAKATDEATLRRCLAIMEPIQLAAEQQRGLLNYHNTLAALYRALGDKANAEKSQAIYDEHIERERERFRAFIQE